MVTASFLWQLVSSEDWMLSRLSMKKKPTWHPVNGQSSLDASQRRLDRTVPSANLRLWSWTLPPIGCQLHLVDNLSAQVASPACSRLDVFRLLARWTVVAVVRHYMPSNCHNYMPASAADDQITTDLSRVDTSDFSRVWCVGNVLCFHSYNSVTSKRQVIDPLCSRRRPSFMVIFVFKSFHSPVSSSNDLAPTVNVLIATTRCTTVP